MPAQLQQQLHTLREQLSKSPPLNDEDRLSLLELMQDIELKLAHEAASAPDASLVDGLNLAVERFESEHPTLAPTLRNILQSLANMGI